MRPLTWTSIIIFQKGTPSLDVWWYFPLAWLAAESLIEMKCRMHETWLSASCLPNLTPKSGQIYADETDRHLAYMLYIYA